MKRPTKEEKTELHKQYIVERIRRKLLIKWVENNPSADEADKQEAAAVLLDMDPEELLEMFFAGEI